LKIRANVVSRKKLIHRGCIATITPYTEVMRNRSSKDKGAAIAAELAATAKNNPGKNPAAVMLGRMGGLKGGKARADKLTAEQRSEIARKAAQARWRTQS
jgi:hypothetical protein